MSDDTSAVTPEDTDNIESQTIGLFTNLTVGSITIVVSLLLFELLRRKIPSVFEARRILNENREHLDYHKNRVFSPASPSFKPFGWVLPVLHLDIDTLAKTHGLDTALFLRYLRTMAGLFFLLLIPSVPLLPVYYTGTFNDTVTVEADKVAKIQLFSLSNVSTDDKWRFWVTLAADYLVLGIVLVVLYREFKLFTKYRIQYRASKNPSNYAILVEDIPKESMSESAVLAYWNRLFPGMVKRVFIIHNAKKLDNLKDKFWTMVADRENAEWALAKNDKLKGKRPTHKIGMLACLRPGAESVDSINYYEEEQKKAASELGMYQENPDSGGFAPVTRAAIVVFDSKRAAAVAAQTNFANKATEWRVTRAPEPKALNWGSFRIRDYQVGPRSTITIVCIMALTILWIIPVTFVMSLTNLTNLVNLKVGGKTPLTWLKFMLDLPPIVRDNIQSFLPAIILSVFLSLVPLFIRIFVNVSRVSSNAQVDILVRDWYFNFVVFSNFLFVLVSGSLFNQLTEITKEPTKLASFLAKSAPKQGAFMMNFVLLKALSETPKELLQLGRVIVRWIVLKYFAKTKRARNAANIGNTEFQFYRYYAISQLIGLLGLIYCTISPFIIPCCFAYFVIMYVVWKYNLCFALHNTYEDGGMMFGGALYGTWTGLLLHLITMIGIFGVNKNPVQSVLIIIPAAASIAFYRMLRANFPRIVQHGSTLETLKRIEESEEADDISDDLVETFLHPSFVPLPDPVENLNGVEGFDSASYDIEKGDNDSEDHTREDEEDDTAEHEKAAAAAAAEGKNGEGDEQGGDDGGEPGTFQKHNTKSTENWVDAEGGGDSTTDAPKR